MERHFLRASICCMSHRANFLTTDDWDFTVLFNENKRLKGSLWDYLPPETREAPPGPLGPSVVFCVSSTTRQIGLRFGFSRLEGGAVTNRLNIELYYLYLNFSVITYQIY